MPQMRQFSRLGLRFATGVLVAATAVPAEVSGSEWDDELVAGDYGRVRYREGGLTISRAEFSDPTGGVETGEPNIPVYPGDRLSTSNNERAELQLADGSLLRLDERTELTLYSLPTPYAANDASTLLQIESGSLRLSAAPSRGDEFRVDTPAASIRLLGDNDLRIDVDAYGSTRVASWRGVVEVRSDRGAMLVRAGSLVEIEPDGTPSAVSAFNTLARDEFDHWVDGRDRIYRVRERYSGGDVQVYASLPVEVRPYYVELAYHGRWVYEPAHGYVWCPNGIGTNWRPYFHGTWSAGPAGYFWVSSEPWGWAPYHYGRWIWIGGQGWGWVPGRVFAGAWVSWSWGPNFVGWCPLDYWGRPLVVGRVHHSGYDPHAWTFVRHEQIAHRNYSQVGLTADRVGPELERTSRVRHAPRVSPRGLAESPQARQRLTDEFRRDSAAGPARGEGLRLRDRERQLLSRPAVTTPVERPSHRPRPRIDHPGRERAAEARPRALPLGRPSLVGPSPSAPGSRSMDRAGTTPKPAPGTETPAPTATEGTIRSTERLRIIYRRLTTPRQTQGSEEKSTTQSPPAETARDAKARPVDDSRRGRAVSPTKSAPPRPAADGGQGRSPGSSARLLPRTGPPVARLATAPKNSTPAAPAERRPPARQAPESSTTRRAEAPSSPSNESSGAEPEPTTAPRPAPPRPGKEGSSGRRRARPQDK